LIKIKKQKRKKFFLLAKEIMNEFIHQMDYSNQVLHLYIYIFFIRSVHYHNQFLVKLLRSVSVHIKNLSEFRIDSELLKQLNHELLI
jgi:hypothetical protein